MGNLSHLGISGLGLPPLLRPAAHPVMHHRLARRLRKLLPRLRVLMLTLRVIPECRIRKDLLKDQLVHPQLAVSGSIKRHCSARALLGSVVIRKVNCVRKNSPVTNPVTT